MQTTKLVDKTDGAKRIKEKNSNKDFGFNGFWCYRTLYITEDCVDIWFEGKRSSLIFEKSIDNKKIYFLHLDQTIIDNFTIESIEPEVVPDYSKYNDYISKIPFQKEPRGFNFDKTNFDLEPESLPLIRIYDNEFIEKVLGLDKSLKVEVIRKEIAPSKNSIFETKKEMGK